MLLLTPACDCGLEKTAAGLVEVRISKDIVHVGHGSVAEALGGRQFQQRGRQRALGCDGREPGLGRNPGGCSGRSGGVKDRLDSARCRASRCRSCTVSVPNLPATSRPTTTTRDWRARASSGYFRVCCRLRRNAAVTAQPGSTSARASALNCACSCCGACACPPRSTRSRACHRQLDALLDAMPAQQLQPGCCRHASCVPCACHDTVRCLCREPCTRISRDDRLAEMNLGVPTADGWRIEVVASSSLSLRHGPPLPQGAQGEAAPTPC